MVGDTELASLRQLYYGLLVRLFQREPDPAFVQSLLEGIDERAEGAAKLNEHLGEGWRRIRAYLREQGTEGIAEEFTLLFLGPFGAKVNPYESYYVRGGFFKEPLIAVRSFMEQVGLEKSDEDYPEPEDVLAFELEIMNGLIGKQLKAGNPEAEAEWLERQGEFLKQHLLVWGPDCARDIEAADGASFYKGVATLLSGLFDVERTAFHGIGPDHILTMEEARSSYGRSKTWEGEVFDGTAPRPPSEPIES